MKTNINRRLAAIMFTDIVGYTALMGSDEARAFEIIQENRKIHKACLNKYGGEWLKEMGDGILCSFPNSSDAVRCAAEIQHKAREKGILHTIGIHEGEVVFDGRDVFGDGVNVASRLEQIAKEGEILISDSINKDVKNKTDITTEYIGDRKLKNVDEPVKVYKAYYQPVESGYPTKDSSEEGPVKQRQSHRKRIPHYLFAGLLIIMVIVWIWYPLPDEQQIAMDSSIIVLPFKNDSPDQENEYFCNGMMEEILTNLQMIEDLRVKSRTTSEKYRYRSYSVMDIGKEVNVAFVLEGSVRKVQDDIRITTQLIDARTGDHLWAETYDGKFSDRIFDFQSRTARKIAASLQAIITPEEGNRIDKKPTDNVLAYDLSLQGHEYLRTWLFTRDSSKLNLGRIYAEEALQIDPEYVGAIDLKALSCMYGGEYDSALYYYDRIIQIDPTNWVGHSGKGHLYMLYLNNVDSAYKYLVKGLQLAPNNSWANLTLGQIYSSIKNEVIRSLPFFERAYELGGETSPEINLQIAIALASIGDYSNALNHMEMALSIRKECILIGYYNYLLLCQKDFNTSKHFLDSICHRSDCELVCTRQRFVVAMLERHMEEAREYYYAAPDAPSLPRFISTLMNACFLLESGRIEEGNNILNNLITTRLDLLDEELNRRDLSISYWILSGAYALRGDITKALDYLEKLEQTAFFAGQQDFIFIFPAFENLWNEPEFLSIMKRVQEKKSAILEQVRAMRESGSLNI